MRDADPTRLPERIPLSGSTAKLVADIDVVERHPGLQLDKYLPLREGRGGRSPEASRRAGGDRSSRGDRHDRSGRHEQDRSRSNEERSHFQEIQKEVLRAVCRTRGSQELLAALLERRRRLLGALSAEVWPAGTVGPLTLHLARAGALENAGISLHPVYGFAYLPGTGLKGMARAFAETVWLPEQDDREGAWRRIEDVFGWAPSPERERHIADPDHPARRRRKDDADPASEEVPASSGTVVFHDAWPETWPQLRLDVISNHHRRYYEDEDDPGDWEGPNLVYFLAVGAKERFSFALSKRRPDLPDDLVAVAREWLTGALAHLGAGAKTAAGYGAFGAPDRVGPVVTWRAVKTFETELALVTPAFLAGANQSAGDCDLRPATLRGLLRWWWRTMHAGFVDRPTLRRLEAAVWGDTRAGGAVRVTVERADDRTSERFAFKEKAQPTLDFRERHHLRSPREAGADDDRKTSWGLFYHAFGMDDRHRYFLSDGARWRVRLTARRGRWSVGREVPRDPTGKGRSGRQKPLDPDLVLSQARAALWLLSHYGGVGSKGRKGFGSFADVDVEGISGLDDCRRLGREFRAACGLGDPVFSVGVAASPSLQQVIVLPDVPTRWTDPWFALNEVGYSAQAFAQDHKHENAKKALGLPRDVRPPFKDGPFTARKGNRHASPVLYHLARAASGTLVVRVVAFPARHLPDLETSTASLEKLLAHLKSDLRERARQVVDGPRPAGDPSRRQQAGPERGAAAPPVAKTDRPPLTPKSGDHVQATLFEEKTKKGGWKARHVPSGLVGEIQNTKDVPTDKTAGEIVTLLVAYAQPRAIAFLWPTPEQEERARKSREGSAGRPGPGGSSRGRRPR